MSLNKTLLALALGLALTAVPGCRAEIHASSEGAQKVEAPEVNLIVSETTHYNVDRIYDPEMGVVCYRYYQNSISCVKVDKPTQPE